MPIRYHGGSTSDPFGTITNPFPASGFYMYNSSGVLELVTIDPSHHFNITTISGSPSTFLFAGYLPLPQG